jgi:hypothetical protein
MRIMVKAHKNTVIDQVEELIAIKVTLANAMQLPFVAICGMDFRMVRS